MPRSLVRPSVLLVLLPPALASQTAAPVQGPPREIPGPELWVSGYDSNAVHRYSTVDGSVLGQLDAVRGAQSVRRGPDGLFYVVAEKRDRVLRYLRTRRVDAFVFDDPGTPEDETGGLDGPTAAAFGPDGNLYVASFETDAILRYDGSTGAYLGDFVPSGSGELDGPDNGTIFGPDGDLYVPSYWNHRVLRYDGRTGAPLGEFIPAGSGGLNNPRVILFRTGGEVWVTSEGSNRVLIYDAQGAFVRELVTYQRPTGMAIGPLDGKLYVTSAVADRVWRFDLVTETKEGTLVPVGAGGLVASTFVAFVEPWGPGWVTRGD